jgi:uncharacterized membrane protein YidH (DUF202 family)
VKIRHHRALRRRPGPPTSFDVGLQQERTSLAWERTAISLMVAATLLARYAAEDGIWPVAGAAFVLATGGGLLLFWTGVHYDDLHETLRSGAAVDHHRLIALVALGTTGVTATALVLSLWLALGP